MLRSSSSTRAVSTVMSTCHGTKLVDQYDVVVNVTFWAHFWSSCCRTCRTCRSFLAQLCFFCFIIAFLLLMLSIAACVLLMLLGPALISIIRRCHMSPMLALEDVSIRSMTVYQNYTVAAPEHQWQVKSEFNVTLSAWNRNKVAGCFSTYRRMVVYVGYHDKLILQQKVPLGFGLKPRRSRPVVVEVKGDHFPVTKQLGQLLDAELRNASSVHFQMYFDTQVMRNDRRAKWIRMKCKVIARTPMNSSQVNGNLLWKECGPS